MAGADLLGGSRQIPPGRLAGALGLAALIFSAYAIALRHMWQLLEDGTSRNGSHDLQHLMVIPLLPITAALLIALEIPLIMYISNYSALQSLAMPRPDHYLRLLLRVYSAWFAEGGKLKEKDM